MVLPVTGTISASQIMSEYNLTTLQYPPDRMTGNLCSFSSTGINYLTNGTYTTTASSNSTVAYNAFNSTSITTSIFNSTSGINTKNTTNISSTTFNFNNSKTIQLLSILVYIKNTANVNVTLTPTPNRSNIYYVHTDISDNSSYPTIMDVSSQNVIINPSETYTINFNSSANFEIKYFTVSSVDYAQIQYTYRSLNEDNINYLTYPTRLMLTNQPAGSSLTTVSIGLKRFWRDNLQQTRPIRIMSILTYVTGWNGSNIMHLLMSVPSAEVDNWIPNPSAAVTVPRTVDLSYLNFIVYPTETIYIDVSTLNPFGTFQAICNTLNGNIYFEYNYVFVDYTPLYDTYWISSNTYNRIDGTYTGLTTTIVDGISYAGEWLQIQLPNPIIATNYTLTCRSGAETFQAPRNFIIAGSNDGINWSLIDNETNQTNWTTSRSITYSLASNTRFYLYYRYICLNSGLGIASAAVGDLSFNGISSYGIANSGRIFERRLPQTTEVEMSDYYNKYYLPTDNLNYFSDAFDSYSGSGNVLVDSMGTSNGTLQGTPIPTYIKRDKGSHFTFDGTQNFISIPNTSSINFTTSNNYSLNSWIWIDSTQNNTITTDNDIIEKWENNSGVTDSPYPYVCRYNRPDNTVFTAFYNGSSGTNVTTQFPILRNAWNNVTTTFRWIDDLPTGLVVRIDARDLVMYGGSTGTVNASVTLDGFSGIAVSRTLPVYRTLVIEKLPYVSFTSTTTTYNYLVKTQSLTFYIDTNGFSFITLFRFTGSNNGNMERVFDFGNGAGNNNILLTRSGTTGKISVFIYSGSTGVNIDGVTSLIQNRWYIVSFRYFKGIAELYINGTLERTSAFNPPPSNRTINTFNYVARSNWSADAYSNVDISCIYMYDKSLTNSEFERVYRYITNPPSMSLYINGTISSQKLLPTRLTIGTISNSFNLYLMRRGGNLGSQYTTGRLGMLSIHGKELSSTEVYNSYLAIRDKYTWDTVTSMNFCLSVRLIVSTYTGPVLRIRRNNGILADVFEDFYTDSNQTYLKTLTGQNYAEWIITVPPSTGYIHTWYDQSGNGNHVTNTSNNATQPYLELVNNKYVIRFVNANDTVLNIPVAASTSRFNTVCCQFYNTNMSYGTLLKGNIDYSLRFGGGFEPTTPNDGGSYVNGDFNSGDWFYSSLGNKLSYVNGTSSQIIARNSWNTIGLSTEIFPIKKPWGCFFAEDFSSNAIPDVSGNNRGNMTTTGTITKSVSSGNGASASINVISGNTTATALFPSGSIPTNFTILSLTRYTGSTNNRRILQSNFGNWLHGHWNGLKGVCYYEVWKTQNAVSVEGSVTNWLCAIGKNTPTVGSILMDGLAMGTNVAGTGGGSYRLAINLGLTEFSDWAMSAVIIWDQILSDDELVYLNDIVQNYLRTGASLRSYFTNSTNLTMIGRGTTPTPTPTPKRNLDGYMSELICHNIALTSYDLLKYYNSNLLLNSTIYPDYIMTDMNSWTTFFKLKTASRPFTNNKDAVLTIPTTSAEPSINLANYRLGNLSGNTKNLLYANSRIQDLDSFVLDFEYNFGNTTTSGADGIYCFIGATTSALGLEYPNGTEDVYVNSIYEYGGYNSFTLGLNIWNSRRIVLSNNGLAVLTVNTEEILKPNIWQQVSLRYRKNSSPGKNLWTIYINYYNTALTSENTVMYTYEDPNGRTFLQYSGNNVGFGFRDDGAVGEVYVRKVRISRPIGTAQLLYSNPCTSLTGWTVSSTPVTTVTFDSRTCYNVVSNSYAYYNLANDSITNMLNKTLVFDVKCTSNISNFYFCCDSSGYGNMFRIDLRTNNPTAFVSGIATTNSWTTWNSPRMTTLSGNKNYSFSTWYTVRIHIHNNATASIYMNNTLRYACYPLVNANNSWIAVNGDSVGTGYFTNIQVYDGIVY